MNRDQILAFFSAAMATGTPIWGGGVSSPAGFAGAVRAGASWLVASHAGGLDPTVPASTIGLLPYADANTETLALGEAARDQKIPVLAGLFAGDQTRIGEKLLSDIKKAGYGGVQNFPSVGLTEGMFKSFLDEAGLGYTLEIEMIREAKRADLFASAVVFDPHQAAEMLKAGADMLVYHPGLTADGEYRHWNASTKKRFADVMAAIPAGHRDIIVARVAFEREEELAADAAVGVQYDRNIDHA